MQIPSDENPLTLQISEDGSVRVGDGTEVGRIQVVDFANPNGLVAENGNRYAAGPNAGDPITQSSSRILSGARELSNTDVGENLIGLSRTSTAFRANLEVIRVADEMFESLLNLRRSN